MCQWTLVSYCYFYEVLFKTWIFLQVWGRSKFFLTNEVHPPRLYQIFIVSRHTYSLSTYQIRWPLPKLTKGIEGILFLIREPEFAVLRSSLFFSSLKVIKVINKKNPSLIWLATVQWLNNTILNQFMRLYLFSLLLEYTSLKSNIIF